MVGNPILFTSSPDQSQGNSEREGGAVYVDIGQESASQDFGSKMRGWMSGETSDGVCLAIMKVLAISGGCNDKA